MCSISTSIIAVTNITFLDNTGILRNCVYKNKILLLTDKFRLHLMPVAFSLRSEALNVRKKGNNINKYLTRCIKAGRKEGFG